MQLWKLNLQLTVKHFLLSLKKVKQLLVLSKPYWLRRIRWPWRYWWSSSYHWYGLEAYQAPIRSCWSWSKLLLKVLKFDKERNRVSLGLKQLGEDPWLAIMSRYPKGSIVKARVTNLTDYGCFAEIAEGVERFSTRFWNGPHNKTSTHLKLFRLVTKLMLWFLKLTKNVVVFLWVSNKLVLTHGKSLLRNEKAKKFQVRSSQSLTSVSSSVYLVVSTV